MSADPDDPLRRLVRADVDTRLRAALDRATEVGTHYEATRGGAAPPPELLELMESISGAPDASLDQRSVHERVASGEATWEQLYRNRRHEGPEVQRLVWTAVGRLSASAPTMDEILAEVAMLGVEPAQPGGPVAPARRADHPGSGSGGRR